MTSVTQRIKAIKQPRGGYLNPRSFEKTQFDDGIELHPQASETVGPQLIGIVVDYLTRFSQGSPANKAFSVSLRGAKNVNETDYANELVSGVKGLDDTSIVNACKLAGFDIAFRGNVALYKPVQELEISPETIFNIKTMVERSNNFFSENGPIIQNDIKFLGGYTSTITTGDADFLTQSTLWDMKVSKVEKISADITLQLLVYYLMGKKSMNEMLFDDVFYLGVFNPRLNVSHILDVTTVDSSIIDDVSENVIGY